MARKPQPLKGGRLTARVLNLACRHLAEHLGITEYTTAQLSHDSGINHSVILRAAQFESQGEKMGPTIQTVKKLADTLKVELDPDLEDSFYNAFGYASPRQLAAARTYVEQQETAEHGEGDQT